MKPTETTTERTISINNDAFQHVLNKCITQMGRNNKTPSLAADCMHLYNA